MDADFFPSASLDMLRCRAALLAGLREFFSREQYWEVETPLLSRDCCVDAWIDPQPVEWAPGESLWLQTSPEFAMKRLLCAGADRIYQITRSFRRDEQGLLHNPEFTILEWYALGSDEHQQMEFVERLIRSQLQTAAELLPNTSRTLPQSIPRLTYQAAFTRWAGIDPFSATNEQLVQAVRAVVQPLPRGMESDREGLLNLLLAERVEPGLKELGAAFLHAYPADQAALARLDSGPPETARRFELYLDGIEICNGYFELTDPEELRRRMQHQNEKRSAAGKQVIPVDSRLLSAMQQGLPDCAGVALGFDRLVMWCLQRERLDEVIAFPRDRA